jgi:hypothetical protein
MFSAWSWPVAIFHMHLAVASPFDISEELHKPDTGTAQQSPCPLHVSITQFVWHLSLSDPASHTDRRRIIGSRQSTNAGRRIRLVASQDAKWHRTSLGIPAKA